MRDPAGPIGVVGLGRLGGAVVRTCEESWLPVCRYDTRQPDGWTDGPKPDVLIDCGAPETTDRVLALAAALGIPLVECVSNLDAGQLGRLADLSGRTAVVRAANLSLGNYLQTKALDLMAEVLHSLTEAGLGVVVPEVAVLERHPVTKAHRPSATATALADHWRLGTGGTVADVASLRAGDPVSDHEVRLTWPSQALVIRHEMRSLTAAAAGAVTAARWVCGRPPGEYSMHAVFDELLNRCSPVCSSNAEP